MLYRPNEFSNAFIRDYKRLLKRHTSLRDCGFCNGDGEFGLNYRSEELEAFRNDPGLKYVERWLDGRRHPFKLWRPGEPTYDQLARHLVHHDGDTLFAVNSHNGGVIWMVYDVDAKGGEPDAQGLAEYVGTRYFGGNVYIEPSRSGVGRHGYWKVEIAYVKGTEFIDVVGRLAQSIKSDPEVRSFQAKFDCFLGVPTAWSHGVGRWRIESRGSPWKLPYCVRAYEDLDALDQLPVTPFPTLRAIADSYPAEAVRRTGPLQPRPKAHATPQGNARYMGGTTSPDLAGLNGHEKKKLMVSSMLRASNGETPDLDTAYEQYVTNYAPTGHSAQDERRRRREIRSVIKGMAKTFRPRHARPFRRHEYLELIRQIVPPEAFHWGRREKISHERLSDLVSVKVQDAFFRKKGFQARASREATVANFKAMRAKGLVDWACDRKQYTQLLRIATEYKLLAVYDEYVRPAWNSAGCTVVKGVPRMIGPGEALAEAYREFEPTAQRHRESMAVLEALCA